MTTQSTPQRTKMETFKVALMMATLVAVVVGLIMAAIGLYTKNDSTLKLSQIANTLNTNPSTPDETTVLFGEPNVPAFRSDAVFRSPEWVAYADLSAPATKDARIQNLIAAQSEANQVTDAHSKDRAETHLTVYKAFIDGGGIDQSREDDQEANAVRLTQKACQAGAGAPAAAYAANWKLNGSDPRPTALLQPGADQAAADAVIQKAYTAAISAGIKYLCP